MLSCSRTNLWSYIVYYSNRYVVYRLRDRSNDQWIGAIFGRFSNRSAALDNKSSWHTPSRRNSGNESEIRLKIVQKISQYQGCALEQGKYFFILAFKNKRPSFSGPSKEDYDILSFKTNNSR